MSIICDDGGQELLYVANEFIECRALNGIFVLGF